MHFNRLSAPLHLHSSFEIVIPSMGIVCANANGSDVLVSPGEMLVLFPGTPHSYYDTENSTGKRCKNIRFRYAPAMFSFMQPGTAISASLCRQ